MKLALLRSPINRTATILDFFTSLLVVYWSYSQKQNTRQTERGRFYFYSNTLLKNPTLRERWKVCEKSEIAMSTFGRLAMTEKEFTREVMRNLLKFVASFKYFQGGTKYENKIFSGG